MKPSTMIGMPFMKAAGMEIAEDPTFMSQNPQIFDSKKLLNEARGPMLLEEIAFLLRLHGGTVTYASQFAAKIEYGRYPLTNGYVPLMCMCPPYNPEAEFSGYSACYYPGGGETPTYWRYGYFSWRLPKPLFVPRGQGLSASFLFTADPRRAAIAPWAPGRIVVAMKGRVLPYATRPPTEQDVPYVTGFAPTYNATASTWNERRSGELALKNPFTNTFHVQRLIARAEVGRSADPAGKIDCSVPVTDSTNQPVWTLVNLTDLHGRPISRDPVAHNSLAGTHALSWTLGVDLPPREGFLVSILEDPGRDPANYPLRLMYHVVGTRKEELLGGCP